MWGCGLHSQPHLYLSLPLEGGYFSALILSIRRKESLNLSEPFL
jgi:hypothetical protein